MKKFRILALILAVVLCAGLMAGCSTSADDITVTLILITDSGVEYFNQEIKVKGEGATVETVVNEANMEYENLQITWTNIGGMSMADYPATTLEDGSSMYWAFTINDVEPKGSASTNSVKDGDKITYTYTEFVSEDTTEE